MTPHTTIVKGEEVREATQEKRTRKIFGLFNLEWWETLHTEHLGNDIHIQTNNPIRNVYLNGEKIN